MKKIIAKNITQPIYLDKYLSNVLKNKTISWIRKNIKKNNIKINNQKSNCNDLLKNGDQIFLYNINLSKNDQSFLKCNLNIPIFYEDEIIIIFNKPQNVKCQQDKKEQINTLNNYLKLYCYQTNQWDIKEPENEPILLHRLDTNTIGLVVALKNKKNSYLFDKNKFIKKYLTIVEAKNIKKSDVLINYWKKIDNNKVEITNDSYNNKKIITKYNLIKSFDKYHLIEVTIDSGKKHQIRSQLAFNNLNIIGDYKYNNKLENKEKHQFLIANEIIFKTNFKQTLYLNKRKFILYKPDEINIKSILKNYQNKNI